MSDNLVLAVQNAPVLRVLDRPGEGGLPALARVLGRDPSNLRKSIKALAEAGWADAERLQITDAGRALLPRLAALEGGGDPATLTHAQIAPSPLNPRKDWTSGDAVAALDALRESILQEGLVQPIAVRRDADANGVRILLAGERRWRAIGMAIEDGDLPPDHPIAVVLRDADDAAHRRLALIENLVRQDLHPLDEAEAFRALREDMPVDQLADLAKRTPRFIQQRIALLQLDDALQDRMRLPAEDPQHLSVTGARNVLQGRPETGGDAQLAGMTLAQLVTAGTPEADAEMRRREVEGRAREAASRAEQIDVEDLAPRQVDLTPAQALILFEVADAARLRPEGKQAVGPTTKVKEGLEPGKRGLEDLTRLVSEGLVMLGQGWPKTVTLLPPGQRWLAGRPGAFMEDDFRLRTARRDAGVAAERIAELEDEEVDDDYVTAWLNLPNPVKHPAPAAEDALNALEVEEAIAAQNAQSWAGAKINRDLAPEDRLKDLFQAKVLRDAGAGHQDGIRRVLTAYEFDRALDQHYPNHADKETRRGYIAQLRSDLGVTTEDKGHAPKWLKGPFAPEPSWEKAQKERAAEAERAEASRKTLEAAQLQVIGAIRTLETEAVTISAEERSTRFLALLTGAGVAGPFRAGDGHGQGQVRGRGGEQPLNGNGWGGQAGMITRRLLALAMNLAAGVDPAAWHDPDAEPEGDLDRDAYVAAGAMELQKLCPDLVLDAAQSIELMNAHLDEWLAADGVSFGQEGYDWTAADAREDAVNCADMLEEKAGDAEEAAA